jgi:acid phosphatase
MRSRFLSLIVIALALPGLAAKEPANLFLLKQEIKTYVDSGEYQQDIARVAAEAEAWLTQRAPRVEGQKLAAVFDVDETLLSNLPHIQKMDYGYQPVEWDTWVDSAHAPAIAPVCDLFRTARKLGLTIFILSGRSEQDRASTEKNLHAAGIDGYAALCLKDKASDEPTGVFKTEWRRKITAEGYTIILNIGDQESDLAGGYAEKTFKLPNPFYITN